MFHKIRRRPPTRKDSAHTFDSMPTKPRDCWGCGEPLVFKTMEGRRVVAFRAKHAEESHSCQRKRYLPPIFLPAMQDYRKQIECPICRKKVYPVPARNETEQFDYMRLFDRVEWPWVIHPHGILAGIWDYKLHDLKASLERPPPGTEPPPPRPLRLVTIVCAQRIVGPDNQHIVALKSVLHERSCIRFEGQAILVPGDLAVLCGNGSDQRLLVASSGSVQTLKWDRNEPPERLFLSHTWLNDEL